MKQIRFVGRRSPGLPRKVAALTVTAAFLITASPASSGSAKATESARTASAVKARLSAAMTGLSRFKTTGSLDEIAQTSHDLRGSLNYSDLTALNASDLTALRRQYVTNYTELLGALEAREDPAFVETDIRYQPRICITPPREPNGHQAPPCAAPSDITEPATRAAYEAALQANADRTKQINLQRQLRYYDDLVAQELKVLLQEFRGRAPDDTAALDAIVRHASISSARKATLRTMYQSPR